ncbi:hypothetical protein [Hymenobacter sp. B1770]|uniref:hypothetical protein n=1 Tax=Hymenobacter sp. B1770 TaxID=1718788 RepID=UPI003CED4A75
MLTPALAQTDTTKTAANDNVYGGFLTLPIEFPVINHAAIDQQLGSAGLPALNYSAANFGLGVQLYLDQFITTFSFNKTTNRKDQGSYLTEVEYRSTSFNFGYDLVKDFRYSAYPYIGFKGCGVSYLYREKLPDDTALRDYLNTPLQYKEITNSRAHLDLGIGLSHQWFYLVNFRAGYLLPLEAARWNMSGNKTPLAASPGISYPYYFSLTLGLGNITSTKQLERHFNR